jgi:hypothetical protein
MPFCDKCCKKYALSTNYKKITMFAAIVGNAPYLVKFVKEKRIGHLILLFHR